MKILTKALPLPGYLILGIGMGGMYDGLVLAAGVVIIDVLSYVGGRLEGNLKPTQTDWSPK